MKESININRIGMKVKSTSLTILLITVFLLAALSGTQFIKEASAVEYAEYTGTLDGADWVLRIPDPWNGMLVVCCRGYSHDPVADVSAVGPFSGMAITLLEQEFAVAASNYGVGGFCVQQGMNTTHQLTEYIIDNYEVTGKVFLIGASMGGSVALLLGEKYPQLYSGVLDMFGAKDIKSQYETNVRWASLNDTELTAELDALTAPSPPTGFPSLEIFRAFCNLTATEIESELGGTPEEEPEAYEAVSPVYNANISVPVITVHGTSDALVPYSQSIVYQEAVANAGRSSLHSLYPVEGAEHGGPDMRTEGLLRFTELVDWSNSMWSMTYGGTGDDSLRGNVVQTSDGGYAISGYTNSFGAGGYDFWLVKTDENGIMEWNMTYGGTLDETCVDMCQTNDGGYVLFGYTASFGAGGDDFWLVKTDVAGNVEWNMTYGGTETEQGICVIQTGDGGYAMSGDTNSFGSGNFDAWVVKTDVDGNVEWNMTYGGSGIDRGKNMVQTSDGGYAITGYPRSFGAGGEDFWLIKTDSAGNLEWNMTYGGAGNDQGDGVVQTSDGGYALTGRTMSFGAGNWDMWFIRTDSEGNMQWNMTYGGPGMEYGIHAILTEDGGYALVGFTSSFGAGNMDFWLVKTDENGIMEWNMTYGGSGMDLSSSVVQTSDGGYAIGGWTNSYGAGDYDFWLVKVDESGVIPESLTIAVVALLSTVSAVVSFRLLRKKPKWKKHQAKKI